VTAPADRPAAGIAFKLAALLSFVLMDVAIKASVQTLPLAVVLWARFAFHLAFVSALLAAMGRRVPPRTRAPRLQAVRSLCLCLANLCFSAALIYIPLAEAVAIGFVSPLITTLLAARMLGEMVGWRRWLGIAVGFAGVLVIIRPGLGVTHPAALLVLSTAAVFAVYQVLTRRLAGVDDAETTIFHTAVAAGAVTTLIAPFDWAWPGATEWAMLALIGAIGGGGHFLLIQAFQRAPASLLAPFTYTQIIWAVIAGWVFFAELPDLLAALGGLVVATGGLFVIWSESRASPVASGVTRR
jgi:drug/metabolite transporter (DMT)-like permease